MVGLSLVTAAALAATFLPGSTEVVVDRKASPATRFAAEELTNVLSQAFGEAVPLVTRFTKGRTAIVVGTNAWSRAAGLAPERLARDGYEIVAAGDRVYVAGCDDPKAAIQKNLREGRVLPCERGSYFGAIGFLEDYAGARFYFPGELGTVVPRHARIEVPDCRRAVVPAYSIRKYSHTADGLWFEGVRRDSLLHSGKALNHMRLRMGTFDIPCCHGQNKFKFLERFGRTHPEYFVMMPDGKRLLRPDVAHPGHICLTSGVWDEMYKDARSYLKGEDASVRGIPGRSPGSFAWGKNCTDGKYVDIMCQDGLIKCHCDVCKAAYNEGKDWARELIWTKTSEIANRLTAEGIPGFITQMAYTGYRSVPDVAIPTNVLVMVAERGPWSVNEPERYKRDTDQIRAWAKKLGNKVWIWTYLCKWRMMDIRDVPNPAPRACAKYYSDLRDAIFGVYAESECDRFLYHYLDYYVTARVCWDPQTDVEALLREHHRLMFGAAADDMAAVYDIFEAKWCKEIAGKTNDTMVGPMGDPPDETTLWTKVYSPDVIADLECRFRMALNKVPEGSLEARRIALVGREFLAPLAKAGRKFVAESDPKMALAEAAEGKYPQLLAESDFSGEARDGLHFGAYDGAKFGLGWSLDGRYRGCARYDAETFVSAPASLRLDSTNRVSLYQSLLGSRGALPAFVPGRRYRISFNVKLENVVPTARGGGVSVHLRDGGDAVFPADTALAGTCGWKRHVYETRASLRWKKPKTPMFELRIFNATGTAWFDDVRFELLPEDPEDVSPIRSASADVKDGYALFAATLDVDFRNIFRGERILPFFVFTDADGKETTLAGTQGPKCEAGVPVSRLPAGDVPYTLELRTRLGAVRGYFDGVLKH